MNPLPAITLYQPWATWIMRGWKPIETRTHKRFACLNNRTILIHAGMKTDHSDYVINNPYLTKEQLEVSGPENMINGYILGTARVIDFRELNQHDSEYALIDCSGRTTRFGLYLRDITKFDSPIPVKGGMGIWYFDLETKQKVKIMSADRGSMSNTTIANGLITPPQR